jgi:hypothetical protein
VYTALLERVYRYLYTGFHRVVIEIIQQCGVVVLMNFTPCNTTVWYCYAPPSPIDEPLSCSPKLPLPLATLIPLSPHFVYHILFMGGEDELLQ